MVRATHRNPSRDSTSVQALSGAVVETTMSSQLAVESIVGALVALPDWMRR
jgi:hypothetical protein